MKRLCPICRSGRTAVFAHVHRYRYLRCNVCELVYLDPLPSAQLVRTTYKGDYVFRVNDTALQRFESITTKVIQQMRTMNPRGRSLLDIGAGYGTGVRLAVHEGLDACGIEPAQNLFRSARNQLGSRMIRADFDQYLKQSSRKFDFILLIHVIEHVRNPQAFIRNVITRLNPNGILYIETPNSQSHLLRIEQDLYTFLTPPDHIHLFGPSSLEILIKNTDGRVLRTSTYSYPEHLVGIMRKLISRAPRYHDSNTGNMSEPAPVDYRAGSQLPFFDRVLAPQITPLLNLGKQGSILQVYIQKNKPLLL